MTQNRDDLVERLSRLLPVSWDNETDGHGEPTHAVLTFGEHQTQAITLCPDDWMALNEVLARLTEANDTIERMREASRPLIEKADYYDLAQIGRPPGGWWHGFTVSVSLGTCRKVRAALETQSIPLRVSTIRESGKKL